MKFLESILPKKWHGLCAAAPGHDSRAIANIFVDKYQQDKKPLTPAELVKLVYLAHGWTLGYTGKELISDPVEAWLYGPAVGQIYDAFLNQASAIRRKAADPKTRKPYTVDGELTESEQQIIDGVYRNYSNLPFDKLCGLTCAEGAPWHEYFSMGSIETIENEDIRAYYEARVKELQTEQSKLS